MKSKLNYRVLSRKKTGIKTIIESRKMKKSVIMRRSRPFFVNVGLSESEYKKVKDFCIDKKLNLRDILLLGITK